MNIYIKKDILCNNDLDNATIGTYIALRIIYSLNRPVQYITDNMLCYELCGNSSYTRYMRQAITSGLDKLNELNLISIKEKVGKDYIIDMSNLFFDTDEDYYVILADTEIHTVFGLTGNTDKFALLRYFACMISTINNKDFVYTRDFEDGVLNNFVGYMKIEYISSLAGIPKQSAITYNKTLEDLGLIFIYRHEKYCSEDGEIKSLANHYGRKCYEKYIEQFATEYEQTLGESKAIIEAKKDANNRRSLTQKYNAFMNDAEYSEEEVFDLYVHILKHNGKYQKIIDGSMDQEIIAKAEKEIKDVSKFEEYFGLAI